MNLLIKNLAVTAALLAGYGADVRSHHGRV
jgi:hypothetical protein